MRKNVCSCMHAVEEDSCVYNSRVRVEERNKSIQNTSLNITAASVYVT